MSAPLPPSSLATPPIRSRLASSTPTSRASPAERVAAAALTGAEAAAATTFDTTVVMHCSKNSNQNIDIEAHVFRARLIKISKPFNDLFTDVPTDKVELFDNDKDEKVATVFMHFLEKDDLPENMPEEIVKNLYILGHKYDIPELMDKLEMIILKDLTDNKLQDKNELKKIFDFAFLYHMPKVKARLFDILYKNPNMQSQFPFSEESSESYRQFLDFLAICKGFEITPSLGEDGHLKVLLREKSLTPDGIQALEALNKFIPITSLEFQEGVGAQSELNALATFLPSLYNISIHNHNFTTLPGTWLESLRKINCCICDGLTTFYAPNATTVDCAFCRSLTTFSAPNATTVECRNCLALTSFTAPKATTVDCTSCDTLITLSAPNATTVKCSNCPLLTTFSAPNATTIGCLRCHALKSFIAPNATTVDCSFCRSLTTFSAPNATTVYCSGCPNLKTLTVKSGCRITKLPRDFTLTTDGITDTYTKIKMEL